ncbi:helix-turn-helix transcriptional regulator [Sediminitomix flava]|uniref:AraC-like DNA-binding protein n=1 Tax=Sediminitomix flava TaxID=379075 RepID=A0A315Z5H3_SEDFL|nr:AraC family transcriptional regulator [Sediminitomix flava]PWJ39158.1 AraC-like DNA-binding protein [Sediminitomix flava]
MDQLVKFTLGRGDMSHVLSEISQTYPGSSWDGQVFTVDTPNTSVKITNLDNLPGVNMSINEVWFDYDVLFQEEAQEETSILIRFVHDSVLFHQGTGNGAVGENQLNSAAMYNTLRAHQVFIPRHRNIRWLTFRVSIETWKKVTYGLLPSIDQLLQRKEEWIIFETIDYNMEKCIRRIFEVQSKNRAERLGFSLAKGMELLTYFFRQLSKRLENDHSVGLVTMDVDTIFLIKNDLIKNIQSPPSIEDLCRKYGMSADRLRNNFKKVFGLPPRQYVLKKRYQEAYQQVKQTNESLSSIAHSLGFSHSSHFANGFKKHFGVSPSALRENK